MVRDNVVKRCKMHMNRARECIKTSLRHHKTNERKSNGEVIYIDDDQVKDGNSPKSYMSLGRSLLSHHTSLGHIFRNTENTKLKAKGGTSWSTETLSRKPCTKLGQERVWWAKAWVGSRYWMCYMSVIDEVRKEYLKRPRQYHT